MTINNIILIAIAGYLIAGALVINTSNFASALVFKVIPCFSAIALLLIAFKII